MTPAVKYDEYNDILCVNTVALPFRVLGTIFLLFGLLIIFAGGLLEGLLVIIVGGIPSFAVGGIIFDKEKGTVTVWRGLIFPFSEDVYYLDDYDYITIVKVWSETPTSG